jgi:hypothetical protein
MGPSPYTLPEEPTISKAAQVGREPSQRNLETLAEAKRIINEAYPTMPLESTSPLAIVEQANGILEQRRARQVSMFPAARIHSPKTLVLEDVPPLVPESPAPRPHVEYTRQPSLPFEGGAEIQGRFPFDRNEIPSLALKAQAVIETPPSQMVDSVVNGGQAAQDMSGGMGMVIDSVAASFAKASMAPESAILNAALKDADALLGGRVIWWKPQFSYLRGIAPDLLAKFMGAVSVKQNVRNTFMTKRVEPWMKKTVRNTETLHDVARLMIDQQARDMKAAGGQGNLSHIKTLTDEQRTEIMLRPGRKQAVDEYLKKILPEFNAWRQAMGHEVDPAQAYWPMRAFDPKRHKGKLRYDVESGALLTAGEVRVKGMRSSTGVTKKRYIAEREAGSEHARTGTASAYLADPWTLFEEEMVERVGAVKTRELKSAVLRESIKPEDLIDDEGYTKPTVTWRGAKVEPATIKFSHFDEAGTETLQAVTVPQPLQAAYDVVMDMARRGEHGGALMHLLNDTVIEQQLRGVAEPIAHSLTAAAGLMESPHLDKVMTSPVRKALAHYWITRLPAILWEVKKMAGPEIAAQAKMARELGAFRAKERKVSLPSEREVAITKLGREMGKAVGLPFKFMRDVVFGDMVESQEGIGGLEHRLKLLQARAIHVGEGVPFAEALHKANEFGGTYVTAMAPKMAQLLRGVPIAGDAFASTMTAGLRLGASTFAGIPIVGSGPAGLVRGTVKGLQARSAAVGAKEFVNQTIHRAQWRNATEMVAGIYGTHMMMTYMLHGKWPWQMPDHGVRGVQVYPIPSMGIGKEDDKPAYLPLRYCMPATSRFLSMTGVKAAYEGIADGDRSFDAISKDMILGATNAWLRRFGTGGGRQVWTLATGRKVSLSKDYEQYRAAEDSANWDRVISSRIKAAASEVLPFAESTLSIKDAYAHGEGPYTSSTMNKIQATLGMFGFELPSGPTATRIAAKPLTDQRRLANSVGEGIVFEASRKFAADPKAEVEYTNKRLREEMDKFTDPAARIWLFKLVMDNGLKQKIKLQVTAAQAQAMAEGN